jgi:anti-anti-sigma factor
MRREHIMSTIVTRLSSDGTQATISIPGRFDFSIHREFREAYSQHDPGRVKFIVDLSQTDYLDSSALGMLLLLRKFSGGDSAGVTIRNAREPVDKILRVANFDKLFEMTGTHAAVTEKS